MILAELFESSNPAVKSNLWKAPIRIQQPNYVGWIEVTVAAPDMVTARRLIKAQYGVQEWHIGATKPA